VVEHGARSRRGTFFNFNGTAGVWRRQAIKDAGGWEHDTLTEDTDLFLSRTAVSDGSFYIYPTSNALPNYGGHERLQDATGSVGQGLMQTAKKILPRVMKSDAPLALKAEAFFHLTANISYPLMVLALHHAAARHDRAVLSGLGPDAGDRPPAFPRFHLFHFQFLSRGAKRAASQKLVAHFPIHAFRDGHLASEFRFATLRP